jgi:hypothetical protein
VLQTSVGGMRWSVLPCQQVQLNADLLMLCTDVDGLFTGNPTDPASEFIPTYCPEVHLCYVTSHLARSSSSCRQAHEHVHAAAHLRPCAMGAPC